MSDTVKIKMTLSTRFVGSEVSETEEVEREFWDSLSDSEKDKYMDEIYQDFLANNNFGGCFVDED